MATAVGASAKRAASYQFSGRAKPKGLLGQSPLPERQPPKNVPDRTLRLTDHQSLITSHGISRYRRYRR
jgi:hypothetical protein